MENIDWAKDRIAAGGFFNTILYRMVAENRHHEDLSVIKGKLLIIGRVYSAEVTRGAGERNEEKTDLEDKLYDHLATTIKRRHKDIDKQINKCNTNGRASFKNIHDIIETHSILNKIIVDAIIEWRQADDRNVNDRISFTSKYLHFHAPMAFFLFDSVVQKELKKQGFKGKHTCWPVGCNEKHKTEYGKHCIRMLKHASENYDECWTPRLIDGHLMGYINHGRPRRREH